MKIYITIVFALLLGLSACTKRELPEPIPGEATIWLKCKLNGYPFELKAGENAVYAHTNTYEDKNVKQFVFSLSAPDLKKSFAIYINNYNDTMGNPQDDLNKTIAPGEYRFSYSNAFPAALQFRPKEISLLYTDEEKKDSYITIPYYQYQTSQAGFEIVSVKDVVADNGQRYKLAQIKFSCQVVCLSKGYQYIITDGEASIPFGY